MPPDPHRQLPLCCPCGEPELYRRGFCHRCYHRRRRDHARFAGRREKVLSRDRWVPAVLLELWAEQHPGAPRQLQLPATR